MSADILIIGGGPAGLACAGRLAAGGNDFQIRLLEKKSRPGGRMCSYEIEEFSFPVDNCQHVITGSCVESLDFFNRYGGEDLFSRREGLTVAGGGRVNYVNNCRWPVPFHLAGFYKELAGISFSSLKAAMKIISLKNAPPRNYPTAGSWLKVNQPPHLNKNLWYPLIRSSLNEEPSRVALKPFKKWVFTGLLSSRQACCLYVPRFSSEVIFSGKIAARLEEEGVEIEYNKEVSRINPAAGSIRLKNGKLREADWIVSAVPPYILPRLLPEKIENSPRFRSLKNWEYSPILTVHLLVEDGDIFPPVSFLKNGFFEWAFQDPHRKDKNYLQLIKSAAHRYKDMRPGDAAEKAKNDLQEAFSAEINILASKVICEKRATISLNPAVERDRFGPRSEAGRLLLAGGWTEAGWPASLEGAVRSGRKAADLIEQNPLDG